MQEDDRHVLLKPLRAGEDALSGDASGTPEAATAARWLVAVAIPDPGSTVRRILSEVSVHDGHKALEGAIRDFFGRMRQDGLPGVLDAADIRIHGATPLDICNDITFEIHDDLPDIEDPEARIDDFDAHPLTCLREAMIDACPEYSGDIPEGPAP